MAKNVKFTILTRQILNAYKQDQSDLKGAIALDLEQKVGIEKPLHPRVCMLY